MHPNPIFRSADDAQNLAQARSRGFGVLCVNGTTGPLLAHVPFLIDAAGGFADLHLLRSNPIARALDGGQPAVIAVSGPDSYISPDWYGMADQVPTWNYTAQHLRGTLMPLPASDLPDLLDRLSAHFEHLLAPKPPWTADKMSPGVRARMERSIAPFRLTITATDGTYKLGQNKPDAARQAAADAAARHGVGQDTAGLGRRMAQATKDT